MKFNLFLSGFTYIYSFVLLLAIGSPTSTYLSYYGQCTQYTCASCFYWISLEFMEFAEWKVTIREIERNESAENWRIDAIKEIRTSVQVICNNITICKQILHDFAYFNLCSRTVERILHRQKYCERNWSNVWKILFNFKYVFIIMCERNLWCAIKRLIYFPKMFNLGAKQSFVWKYHQVFRFFFRLVKIIMH